MSLYCLLNRVKDIMGITYQTF